MRLASLTLSSKMENTVVNTNSSGIALYKKINGAASAVGEGSMAVQFVHQVLAGQ
jgi:hypothetical protein